MNPEKRPLTHSLPAKVTAFILLVLMAGVSLGGFFGALFLGEAGFYSQSLEQMRALHVGTATITTITTNGITSIGQTESARLITMLIDIGYALRFWIYPIIIAALIVTVVCFVFLMCSAGHRRGSEEIKGIALGIPFDLLTCAFGLVVGLDIVFFGNYIRYYAADLQAIAGVAFLLAIVVIVFTGWCMAFAARVKRGKWWRKTIIYQLARFLWRALKAGGHALVLLAQNIPLIWKALVAFLAISLLEFLGILWLWNEPAIDLVTLWFVEKLLLVAAICYLTIIMRRLQKGGQALAAGDLSQHIDTHHLFGSFRQHGEHLNSIALGMTRAVEERLRSERLKTELITNVSHDLKTPLTSIINYADLIALEPTDNEKIVEYAQVLRRQSERLHKLLEGLIEASRATTGNIEVHLAPCEVGVLLAQTVGEYEQRAREQGLELVTRQPQSSVRILADGRHLWRVFDNLMNNICQYAQSGTRAYLTVEAAAGMVALSFKNTSRDPLDIPAHELLERFVRGDGSRSTEGSGLGLSIAQSLTELQGGRLELSIDGDLFKATLRFRVLA
ncbi:MAG: HAMP domain-containing histidine kinase [Coriobacteriales bacterium]|jgi:signal transduction histidine kinase|nr:HAMP domain-containing histidine kinase [Coriobacteriales bacterium]